MCKFRHSREKWSRLEKSEDDEERGNDVQGKKKVYRKKTRRSNNGKKCGATSFGPSIYHRINKCNTSRGGDALKSSNIKY